MKELLANIGSGGGAAAPAAGGAAAGADAGAAAEETKAEAKVEGQYYSISPRTTLGAIPGFPLRPGGAPKLPYRRKRADRVVIYREGRVRRRHGFRSLRLEWFLAPRLLFHLYLKSLHGWRRVLLNTGPHTQRTGWRL